MTLTIIRGWTNLDLHHEYGVRGCDGPLSVDPFWTMNGRCCNYVGNTV